MKTQSTMSKTVRDHVFRAGMEMKEGNWIGCFEYEFYCGTERVAGFLKTGTSQCLNISRKVKNSHLSQLEFWDKLTAKEQCRRLVEREVTRNSETQIFFPEIPQKKNRVG